MFQGVDYGSLDDKGRIAVPARHRELLQSLDAKYLIATAHHQECCIVLRTPKRWKQLVEDLQNTPNAERGTQTIRRKLLGYAQDLNFDANGRISLPQALRSFAVLKKKVVIAGLGDSLELWNAPDWDTQMNLPLTQLPEAVVKIHF